MLLSNTQVSGVDASPSHMVTSSGSLITVVENYYTVYVSYFDVRIANDETILL